MKNKNSEKPMNYNDYKKQQTAKTNEKLRKKLAGYIGVPAAYGDSGKLCLRESKMPFNPAFDYVHKSGQLLFAKIVEVHEDFVIAEIIEVKPKAGFFRATIDQKVIAKDIGIPFDKIKFVPNQTSAILMDQIANAD